jgi:hypothetical protein
VVGNWEIGKIFGLRISVGKAHVCLESSRKQSDNGLHHVRQIIKRSRDGFSGDRVRLAERYVKGELYTLLTFTIAGYTPEYIALIQPRSLDKSGEGGISPLWRKREHYFLRDVDGYRHEQPMLVSVIQGMEKPEVVSVPSTVRFYRVDELLGLWRHALCFSFRIGYELLGTLADREIDKLGIVASAPDKFGGQVIESAPEVLDSISDCSRQAGGHSGEWPHDAFGRIRFGIELGYNQIRLRVEESDSLSVELTDVLFGPFNFGVASTKV